VKAELGKFAGQAVAKIVARQLVDVVVGRKCCWARLLGVCTSRKSLDTVVESHCCSSRSLISREIDAVKLQ
jgi:hypothetical protein